MRGRIFLGNRFFAPSGYSYLIYCLGEEGDKSGRNITFLIFSLPFFFPCFKTSKGLAFKRDIASKDLCCIPRDSFEGQVHRGAVQRRSLWTPAIVSACHSPNMSRNIQSTTLRSLPLAECGEIRQEIRTPETQAGEPERAGNIH